MFILPVSLKLVQFEVSTLKSEEVHILEFSGEDREPPLTFLVERIKIFLLQTSKVEGCSAKGVHQFVMTLDKNKYTYIGFLLERFHFIGCTGVRLALPKISPVMQFVVN